MIKRNKGIPEGIKILSVLYFAAALVLMLVGGFLFSFTDSLRAMDTSVLVQAGLEQLSPSMLIGAGLVMIALSVLYYFVARDLSSGKNWARMIVGLLSALGIVSAVSGLAKGAYVGSVFSLAANGLIMWYLFVKKSTKKFFK